MEGPAIMKNPLEVLRSKEQELVRVRKEIEALRIVASLVGAEPPTNGEAKQDLRTLIQMP